MKKLRLGFESRFLSLDRFGHPIGLNFNRKGNTYKTAFGACISILMVALFGLYLAVLVLRFSSPEYSKSQKGTLINDSTDPITMENAKISHFHILSRVSDSGNAKELVPYDQETRKYISLMYL